MKYVVTRNNHPVSVARDFDALFNSLWSNWGVNTAKLPAVDIHESEKTYVLEAELPGFEEKNISVTIDNHVLKIASIQETEKEETPKDEKQYLIHERYSQQFERSFTLPEGIDEDNISGEFKNGVLVLTMPKVPEKQAKKIDVRISK